MSALRHLSRALAVFALLGFAAPASAYVASGPKWGLRNGEQVEYHLSNRCSGDVADRDCVEGLKIGYDVWTALPCSYMKWAFQGRTDNVAWGMQDGQNISVFYEEGWNESSIVLGQAQWSTGVGGHIADCDIRFNGVDHQWDHFLEPQPGSGRQDIAGVAAHEAGHCIGLAHTDVAGSTMTPTASPPGTLDDRSLGADDILGACELYPSGGDIPEPSEDPPQAIGETPFGGDCRQESCQESLFCISDGRESFCTRLCEDNPDCGDGYYCAQLNGGGGACARGTPPEQVGAGLGNQCGNGVACEQGLLCLDDGEGIYCSSHCLGGVCPTGWFCVDQPGGYDVCVRGEEAAGVLPGLGGDCGERGICRRGFFCYVDDFHTDEESGARLPYCTESCQDSQCAEGYRCVDIPPDGTACQIVPTPGERSIGAECWVDPEAPHRAPRCGGDLVCVDYRIESEVVTEIGFCTQNCTAAQCCPDGWGCRAVTPAVGQCRQGMADSDGFECVGGGQGGGGGVDPGLDAGEPGVDAGPPAAADEGGDSGGCAVGGRHLPAGPFGLLGGLLLLAVACLRRARLARVTGPS